MWPPHTFSRARRSGPGLTLLCLAAACGFSGAAAGEARARKATGAPPSPVQLLAKVNKGIDRIVDKLSAVKSNMATIRHGVAKGSNTTKRIEAMLTDLESKQFEDRKEDLQSLKELNRLQTVVTLMRAEEMSGDKDDRKAEDRHKDLRAVVKDMVAVKAERDKLDHMAMYQQEMYWTTKATAILLVVALYMAKDHARTYLTHITATLWRGLVYLMDMDGDGDGPPAADMPGSAQEQGAGVLPTTPTTPPYGAAFARRSSEQSLASIHRFPSGAPVRQNSFDSRNSLMVPGHDYETAVVPRGTDSGPDASASDASTNRHDGDKAVPASVSTQALADGFKYKVLADEDARLTPRKSNSFRERRKKGRKPDAPKNPQLLQRWTASFKHPKRSGSTNSNSNSQ